MVNPARAGMIPARGLFQILFRGKPRASGDDPYQYLNSADRAAVNPARAGMIPLFDANWAVIFW